MSDLRFRDCRGPTLFGMARLGALALLGLALSAHAAAQQHLPPHREIMEVTVANVEVIVTDADGNRIRGLTRDDFELLENGRAVRVSNFAEVTENVISIESSPAPDALAAPPSEIEPPRAAPVRRVVVFVDLTTVGGIRRRNAIKSISEFLDQLAPEDERMIVSWDDAALKVEVPPGAARVLCQAASQLEVNSRRLDQMSEDPVSRDLKGFGSARKRATVRID